MSIATQPGSAAGMSLSVGATSARPSTSSQSGSKPPVKPQTQAPAKDKPARTRFDPAEFTFSRVLGGERDARLFVMDVSAQTTVDACTRSFIYIAPCSGSVFLRDCGDCTVVVAAHQLRLRGCKNIRLSLYTATQPVIESSSDITVSCFQYAYNGLKAQFASAALDPSNNPWSPMYDFTATGTQNWRAVDTQIHTDPDWAVHTPSRESNAPQVTFDDSSRLVPLTPPSS
ncbi:Protein Xrp2 [Polyrhizophydium stewartii]|uniref:Protein Xrp2 n=1 Tax=Polyrhizophydium stewartii TaxID=2732419 RepID=A0ABR4NC54_9FUNG